MSQSLPPPLTPRDADLRDFQFMPLDIQRLRRSKAWLICKRRPELAFYSINLWTAAWHDFPAGSLEDDDDVLADLAMCPPKEWPKVRADVLRGWIKCSDGRLYHPVVCEKVVEAWKSKKLHAYGRECGRLRKQATRAGIKDFKAPPFEEWLEAQASGGQMILSNGHAVMSKGQAVMSKGQSTDIYRTSQGNPPENALKGQGEGEGQGQGQGHICASRMSGGQMSTGQDAPEKGRYPHDFDHHAEFKRRVLERYPKTTHVVNEIVAQQHCMTLIEVHGLTWEDIGDIVDRFRAWVKAGGRSNPRYVEAPQTLFSPSGNLWKQPFDPPPSDAEVRMESNVDAAAQAKRELLEESRR